MAALSPQTSRTERPRAVSALSHASTHSHGTFRSRDNNKVEKIDLTEHSSDKKRLEGKSDPTKALNEAQPAAVALEHSNLEDIRVGQYKDREGNIITDPDRCNPTRPRMERPLDTIRQFNAAAEGTTSRRSSYQRPPSFSGMEGQPKRTSQYGGPPNSMYSQNGRPGPRTPQGNGGYYRNSSYNMRPDYQEDGGPVQQGPPRAHHGRYQSQPYMQQGDSPTSVHSHQPSYETMTSGSDENSKSTNPSSQNSSYDQLHQMGPPKHQGEYPHNPHRQNGGPMRNPYPPSAMPNGYSNGYSNGYNNGHSNGHNNGHSNGYSNGYGQRPSGPTDDYGMEFQQSAPLPPPKRFEDGANGAAPLRMTLQKTNSNSQTQRVQEEPKRQSWIKRRFSKKA